MSENAKYRTLSTRIPAALYDRIDMLAKDTGRTKSYYIQKMLEDGIEDIEVFHLAKMRSEEVRSGKSKVFTREEIRAQNGL